MSQWIDAGPRGDRITVDNTLSLDDKGVLHVRNYEIALTEKALRYLNLRTAQLLKEAAK